jgi:HAD superfamily hydrolase (TIGR01549 family)
VSSGHRAPRELRGVLYDLDGVLINSGRAWYNVLLRGLREAGRPPVSWARFQGTFGQGVDADRAEFFPEWSASQLGAFYAHAFVEELPAVDVLDGALQALDELRARGLRQAVVTNTPVELARRVLELKGIASRVDALAASGEGAEKPAPDLLLLALERLRLRRDHALYVGDSEVDHAAARAASVTMVGIGIAAEVTLAGVRELPAWLAQRGGSSR